MYVGYVTNHQAFSAGRAWTAGHKTTTTGHAGVCVCGGGGGGGGGVAEVHSY